MMTSPIILRCGISDTIALVTKDAGGGVKMTHEQRPIAARRKSEQNQQYATA
jgi:hypothetical protein